MIDLLPSARRFSAWVTPVLLFSVAEELFARGTEGLWIALLMVVAPLLGLLPASRRDPLPAHPVLTAALLPLAVLLLWANLLLAGGVAARMGLSQGSGVLVASAAMLIVGADERAWRCAPALGLVALVLLFTPLAMIVGAAGKWPLATWNQVASLPAFRFSSDSPWVTEGRPLVPHRGADTLLFEEQHRITAVADGPVRVLGGDSGRARAQEWTLTANQSLTLRPGDRLVVEPGRVLRFEAAKRIPGAPASGVSWAELPRDPLLPRLLSVLGLGLTLVGGASALLLYERGRSISPVGAVMTGAGYLLALAWAQGWAVYAAALTPELFLGGVTPEKLFELPAQGLRAGPGRPLAVWLLLLGGFTALLATGASLRGLLARGVEGRRLWVWGGMLAGAALLATFWPLDPWRVLLVAFGLGASTLGPLLWIGIPKRPVALGLAVGGGLLSFAALAVLAPLLSDSGGWARTVLSYPALAAGPVTAWLAWVGRRLGG